MVKLSGKAKAAFLKRMSAGKKHAARERVIAVKSGRIKKGAKLSNVQIGAYQAKIEQLDNMIKFMKNEVKADPDYTINFSQSFLRTRKELARLRKEMQKLKK